MLPGDTAPFQLHQGNMFSETPYVCGDSDLQEQLVEAQVSNHFEKRRNRTFRDVKQVCTSLRNKEQRNTKWSSGSSSGCEGGSSSRNRMIDSSNSSSSSSSSSSSIGDCRNGNKIYKW